MSPVQIEIKLNFMKSVIFRKMIESIAEKFKRLGCSFLEKVEVSTDNAWINGTILFIFNFLTYFLLFSF